MINSKWHVIPCHSIQNGKCTCKQGCKSPGKHPKTKNGVLDATNDWQQIEQWIYKDPTLNLGVRTGPESGIWVLDVDYKDYPEIMLPSEDFIELPITLTAETPRGFHYYFNWPKNQWLRNRTNVFDKVDVRGQNGYVILSFQNNGYRWANDNPIIDAPIWLLERVCGT